MTKDRIILSTEILVRDINKCLTDLVHARMHHDHIQEEGAQIRMESLLCSAQQQLCFFMDYLKEEDTK